VRATETRSTQASQGSDTTVGGLPIPLSPVGLRASGGVLRTRGPRLPSTGRPGCSPLASTRSAALRQTRGKRPATRRNENAGGQQYNASGRTTRVGRHRPAVIGREHGRRLSSADQPGEVLECADGCVPVTVARWTCSSAAWRPGRRLLISDRATRSSCGSPPTTERRQPPGQPAPQQ
jgi:hypothetical protein